ncbi:MAG: S41 family peptidase [Cyanobacteria bacterium J06632_22]
MSELEKRPSIPREGKQTELTAEDIDLDAKLRSHLLLQLETELGRYALPDVAEKLQMALRHRRDTETGETAATSGRQFAEMLTAELQTLSQDQQLRVHFSPVPLPDLSAASPPTTAELAHQRAQSQQRSYDINRVERLGGNVGYLQLFGFEPPEFAGASLAAAMTLLAHTDALVIDLRHNQGGSPQMVALLCSYLLPAYPAVHLSTLQWPPSGNPNDEHADGRSIQSWTVPHLDAPRYLDRPVYALSSPETRAAAEEFVYVLQHLKRIVLVGETTAGGANPGQGYRLHDHFWVFIPTGRVVSPLTQANWSGTGVIPDFKVPSELAVTTGHLLALKHLERNGLGLQREIQAVMPTVEQRLDQMQHDLIGQMTGRG